MFSLSALWSTTNRMEGNKHCHNEHLSRNYEEKRQQSFRLYSIETDGGIGGG